MRKLLVITLFISINAPAQKKFRETVATLALKVEALQKKVDALQPGGVSVDYGPQILKLQQAQIVADLNMVNINKALSDSISKLNARLNAIKVYAPVDITPLINRVTQLEGKPTGSVDLGPVLNRLTLLENKPVQVVDLSPILQRVTTLENKTPSTVDLAPINNKLAEVENKINTLPAAKDFGPAIQVLQDKITTLPSKDFTPDIQAIKAQVASIPQAKDYTADITAIKSQIAAIKIPDYTADLTALRSQVASIKVVDFKPTIDNLTAQLAAMTTSFKGLPGDLAMQGFPGDGTAAKPFQNMHLNYTQAQRLALKVPVGWEVYQTDAPAGKYMMKAEGWVFVK